MTLSQLSRKFVILIAATGLGATATIVAPMARAADGPFVKVELAKPVSKSSKIIRGAMVTCEGSSCVAGKVQTSPVNSCILVAREFGEIAAFSAGDRQLTQDELSKCNGDKRAQAARESSENVATR